MRSFIMIVITSLFLVSVLGCNNTINEVTDQMIDEVIREHNLDVVDVKKTSQGAVFIFFENKKQIGAYTLYMDEHHQLVKGMNGLVSESTEDINLAENKALLAGYLDGAVGLMINDDQLLNQATYCKVFMDGEFQKELLMDNQERTYIIELESFVRSKHQVVSVKFFDSNDNEIHL